MFLTHPVKHGGGERLSKSLSQSKYDESFDKINAKDAWKVANIDSFTMKNSMSLRHHRPASAT